MLVCIFGKRGSGKTVLTMDALQKCEAPVVVLDILGNYTSEKIPNAYETDSISDAIQKIKDYNDYQAANDYERGLMEEAMPVIILQPADPDEAVDYISAALWEAHGGTLVLDEADGFNIHNAPCFDQLIRYGRNRRIHILTGTRRPAEISRNITAGANAIYIFQTQEPRDIEYYSKTLIGKEQAERLNSLPDYHGLFVNYDKKTIGVFKTNEKGEVFILEENFINSNGSSSKT